MVTRPLTELEARVLLCLLPGAKGDAVTLAHRYRPRFLTGAIRRLVARGLMRHSRSSPRITRAGRSELRAARHCNRRAGKRDCNDEVCACRCVGCLIRVATEAHRQRRTSEDA